jgi:hypothetical protein
VITHRVELTGSGSTSSHARAGTRQHIRWFLRRAFLLANEIVEAAPELGDRVKAFASASQILESSIYYIAVRQ